MAQVKFLQPSAVISSCFWIGCFKYRNQVCNHLQSAGKVTLMYHKHTACNMFVISCDKLVKPVAIYTHIHIKYLDSVHPEPRIYTFRKSSISAVLLYRSRTRSSLMQRDTSQMSCSLWQIAIEQQRSNHCMQETGFSTAQVCYFDLSKPQFYSLTILSCLDHWKPLPASN